jgi:hypothetical protein
MTRCSHAGTSAGGTVAVRGAALDRRAQGLGLLAGERPHAVQRLVQRGAEAEEVAAGVGLAAGELLGGHVRGRAQHRARRGQARGAGEARVGSRPGSASGPGGIVGRGRGGGSWAWAVLRDRSGADRTGRGCLEGQVDAGDRDAGEAEVEDAGALVVVADEHVVGLEVAVDEAAGVGGGEAPAGLQVHGDDVRQGRGAAVCQARRVWPWTNSMAR